MAYTCDYSSDYSYVDGVESVTYVAPNGSTTVSNVKARRGTLSHADITAGQAFGVTPGDVAFVLWRGTLSGNTPAQGATITDSDTVSYTVLQVTKRADNAQFRCICRRHVS